jgi:hypothetical protein
MHEQAGARIRFPAYLSYRPAGRLYRLVELILRNRFLGSFIVYKYGLWAAAPELTENQSQSKIFL